MATAVRRTRLEHDERRRQILDAARALFCQRSYAEVSSEEIARAAGIRRGLLHHYFGSKRDLYLEVVRELLARAVIPAPDEAGGGAGTVDQVVARNVDLWLDFVEHDKESWLAALSASGFGRDPELEQMVSEAREAMVERIIAVLDLDTAGHLTRAVLRAYAGLAEEATREWLLRGSLSRPEIHALLSEALLAMVRDVVPAVERSGSARDVITS